MKKIVYLVLACLIGNYYYKRRTYIKNTLFRQLPYDVEVVAENLWIPWAIAISDEGKIYFTERPGVVRMIEKGRLYPQPIISLGSPFISEGEGGLMGIVLDPDFLNNRYMYVMHTYSEGNQLYNRVIRLVEKDNTASIDRVILDKITGGQIHDGGRIKIGPDQKLYITTGDAGKSHLSQDFNSLAGKILRIELDGSIPEDNPIKNSPIYSFGHRNPEGIAWNKNNMLYASEHGQLAHDEINLIEPGANYGWPLVQGDETLENMNLKKPLLHSDNETWAPSGIAFVKEGPWNGKLLVATLRGNRLLALSLDETGRQIQEVESWLVNEFGRLREIIQAPDGSIYLTTSNRDGRGNPDLTDDKIIRLIPR